MSTTYRLTETDLFIVRQRTRVLCAMHRGKKSTVVLRGDGVAGIHRVGVAGEIAFSRYIGKRLPDLNMNGFGDGGVDQECLFPDGSLALVDVKSSDKPGRVMVRVDSLPKSRANCFVMAIVKGLEVELCGWITRDRLIAECPVKDYGRPGYVITPDRLLPIGVLRRE